MFSEITRTELLNLGKKISDGLNSEGLKWIKSFTSKLEGNNPKNALTKKDYQGLNWWNLGLNTMDKGYNTNYYATKKAWLSVGATIKDIETKNGIQVFYWGQVGKKIKDEKTNDEKLKTYRFLKISYAYNVAQVDLRDSSWKIPTPKKIVNQVDENDKIENFVKNQMGLNLQYSNNDRCYYSPKLDYIHMSNKFNFEPTKNGTDATLEYYSTLLHELTHWTGSEKRLNRFEKNKKYFDNNAQLEYALEELIAEIGANILCCKFDIQKTINKNSLAYLKSWISKLKNDELFILKSLTQSGQAVNFLKDNLKNPVALNPNKPVIAIKTA
jgi:antirestriction protein ArdC